VPGQGTSYGLLRYMRGDLALAQQLETLPQPEVFLNFLGHAAERSDTEAAQQEDFGAHRNPCHARSWLIYCRATVQGEALVVEWEYSANRHRHETMAALAQACRAFLLDLAGMEETAGGRKLSLEKE
jgi:non-ribosomal peptide synthase protein (TIGR01720 family)